MLTWLLFLEHVRLNSLKRWQSASLGGWLSLGGYAKMRQCNTAGRPLRIEEQYRYGSPTSLSRTIAGYCETIVVECCCLDFSLTSKYVPAPREFPEAAQNRRDLKHALCSVGRSIAIPQLTLQIRTIPLRTFCVLSSLDSVKCKRPRGWVR